MRPTTIILGVGAVAVAGLLIYAVARPRAAAKKARAPAPCDALDAAGDLAAGGSAAGALGAGVGGPVGAGVGALAGGAYSYANSKCAQKQVGDLIDDAAKSYKRQKKKAKKGDICDADFSSVGAGAVTVAKYGLLLPVGVTCAAYKGAGWLSGGW